MSRYDDDDDSFERPSGGGSSRGPSSTGVGPSSIAYESRRRPGRRRLITSLVVLVALGGFVGIVWHAYNQGKAGGGDAVVPLLKADDSPTKVRPDQPGGMDVPNQDKLIYDRLAPGGQIATPHRLEHAREVPAAFDRQAGIPSAFKFESIGLDLDMLKARKPIGQGPHVATALNIVLAAQRVQSAAKTPDVSSKQSEVDQ